MQTGCCPINPGNFSSSSIKATKFATGNTGPHARTSVSACLAGTSSTSFLLVRPQAIICTRCCVAKSSDCWSPPAAAFLMIIMAVSSAWCRIPERWSPKKAKTGFSTFLLGLPPPPYTASAAAIKELKDCLIKPSSSGFLSTPVIARAKSFRRAETAAGEAAGMALRSTKSKAETVATGVPGFCSAATAPAKYAVALGFARFEQITERRTCKQIAAALQASSPLAALASISLTNGGSLSIGAPSS
mmetsp:Transcript_120156/g.383616  ORF Transcript_120156/g.383616 Transcript_120156/m.383616 type:complete len:245 (+) Transcript_120156:3391-4125(+)